MSTRTKQAAKAQVIPAGWGDGRRDARVTQLRQLPARVRVLLAAEWARSVLPIYERQRPGDDRPRKAIEAAEAWAYDPCERTKSAAADAAADAAAAAYAAAAADAAAAGEKTWLWLYATYRHARGPVGVPFDPRWATPTVVALARGIATDRAFDRMPVIADALEEAGCDLGDELLRLRADGDEFTAADWSLWNPLGLGV